MNTNCACSDYDHMELYRRNISRRIRDTQGIQGRLVLIAEHPNKTHSLYKCEVCGQFWQSSYAWNWGGKEYIYKVSPITLEDWTAQPYIQPDQLLIYNAVMSNWYDRNHFTETDEPCRRSGCLHMSLSGLAQCLEHHIEDLQRAHVLPMPPQGRWFSPYVGPEE